MTVTHTSIVFCVLISLSAASSFADIPIIDNPQHAPVERIIPMEECWRIGDDPAEDFILGVIGKVIGDEAGNFYLLDTQQSEVFKFSPDGQYLKSVSRKGEGPGELGRCYFFGFWDENTIACFSGFPHKFIRFDLEGIPAETMSPVPNEAHENAGRMALGRFVRRDGYLVAHGSFFLFEDGHNTQKAFLSGFDNQAEETVCYDEAPTGYDFRRPILVDEEADFIARRRWALGRRGEVYTAPHRTDYLIEVHDAGGNLLRRISREWPLHKRSKDEKEEAKNRYSFGVSGGEMPEISYKIAEHAQTIERLDWIDDQLWVTTTGGGQKTADEDVFEVDVFDAEGHLLEKRGYQLPIDPANDRVHWLDAGRAVVVKNFASASAASRNSNTTVQRGDRKQDPSFEDDFVLEVILYQAKD
jgi:6-bladed beta-propeller